MNGRIGQMDFVIYFFMAFDVISIGDTNTDLYLSIDKKNPYCKVDKKKNELKLKYRAKIPVKDISRVIGGGNASNHVIGASRLGLKAAIYTILGCDDAGDTAKQKFCREKVSCKYIKFDRTKGTNISTIIDYADDRTILSYHAVRHYKLPKFEKTKWIFFSSINGNHEEFTTELMAYVKKNKIKLGFNPGSLQLSLGLEKLRHIISAAEVLFVNLQEAQLLTKKKNSIKILLKDLHNTGVKIVVITDGGNGSYCYNGKEMWHLGTMDLPVVEITGCGDAFASGFVAGLANGNKIPEAMRWAGANAASVAMRIGPQAGLLTKKQIISMLSHRRHFKPKILP